MQAYSDHAGIQETLETRYTASLQSAAEDLWRKMQVRQGCLSVFTHVRESSCDMYANWQKKIAINNFATVCRLATFYSRSRQQRWCKGETSGNYIHVKGLFLDCDRDSVVYLGEPDGPSCHTVHPLKVYILE